MTSLDRNIPKCRIAPGPIIDQETDVRAGDPTYRLRIFDILNQIAMASQISGFSKLSKQEKIEWIAQHYSQDPETAKKVMAQYWNADDDLQRLHDEFIENTLTNYYLPFGIAPNFPINGKLHALPMAIEESSVVAAASKTAKYWLSRGGFKATVVGTEKTGQVHFMYFGDKAKLRRYFHQVRPTLFSATEPITKNMRKRGGGITKLELLDKTAEMEGYYQLHCGFGTGDAMGANFINSCLEQMARTFVQKAGSFPSFTDKEADIQIVMSILSNYVPDCLVRAEVGCEVSALTENADMPPEQFAQKILRAVNIAQIEPYRAVTHNKGIMNGIDAVVLATGNDFRAVEAGIHAYAARNGSYSSLTHAEVEDGFFKFWIEVPLALGTVGGLTALHPLSKLALDILGGPSAQDLMQIVAVAGLAQNFAALRSLVTTGIQKGHMKMHLLNILNQLGANEAEKKALILFFKNHVATHDAVVTALEELRKTHGQNVL